MKNFDEIYNELTSSTNENFNKLWLEAKKEKNKSKKICFFLCLIIDVIWLIVFVIPNLIMFSNLRFNMFNIVTLIIPVFVIDIFVYVFVNLFFSKNQNKYMKAYKSIIIKKLMKNFYTNLEYYPDKQMPKYIYDEGNFNEYYNRYDSEDYLEAQIQNKYSIQMAEVLTKQVENHTDSAGKTTTTTRIIFDGLFAKVVMDKSINSTLKIMQDGKLFLNGNKLKMDSSEFEKYFDVQASNKIIGMQLLTADIMEELIEFQNKTNINYEIIINNNNIYLRFHCGNMFEPKSIESSAINENELKKYFYMLNFTYNLSSKITKLVEETEI